MGPGGHHLDALAGIEVPVDHPHVGDDAAVGVVHRVEDEGPGWGGRVAGRCGDQADDLVEQLAHALPGLGAHLQHVVGVAADDVRQLGGVPRRLGRGQVDLVEHRDDLQVVLEREVEVGQGLGLDALGGVDEQDRPLAGGEAARDLVGEVDVAGRVDEVDDVVHPVGGPVRQAHGLALDRDAALALDVHAVQVLGAHRPVVDHPRDLQHAIGQCGLAVVDVGDDAEVADDRLVGRPGGWQHGGNGPTRAGTSPASASCRGARSISPSAPRRPRRCRRRTGRRPHRPRRRSPDRSCPGSGRPPCRPRRARPRPPARRRRAAPRPP